MEPKQRHPALPSCLSEGILLWAGKGAASKPSQHSHRFKQDRMQPLPTQSNLYFSVSQCNCLQYRFFPSFSPLFPCSSVVKTLTFVMLTRETVTQTQAHPRAILPCHSPHPCKDWDTFPANTGTLLAPSPSSFDWGNISEALLAVSCQSAPQLPSVRVLCPHTFPRAPNHSQDSVRSEDVQTLVLGGL